MEIDVRMTYDEAVNLKNACAKPMYILQGDNCEFWIVDLTDANKLIRKGYKIAQKEAKTMEVIKKSPEKYTITRSGKKLFSLVRILKDYDDERQAINDMAAIMSGDKTEQSITSNNSLIISEGKYDYEDFINGVLRQYRCPQCGSLCIEDGFCFCPSCGRKIEFVK